MRFETVLGSDKTLNISILSNFKLTIKSLTINVLQNK